MQPKVDVMAKLSLCGAVASRVTRASALTLLVTAQAVSAATPAGTIITNVARIDYSLNGASRTGSSNQVNLRVGEIIDFAVTPAATCSTPHPDGVIVVGFDITNRGNGFEAFIPGTPIVVDAPDFILTGVFSDSDGSECYEDGTDQLLPPGGKTPQLAAGGRVRIFVVGRSRSGGGRIILPVAAENSSVQNSVGGIGGGSGRGDGGGDVVVVPPGGAITDVAAPFPTPLAASLVKSQSVRAPDGSARPLRGAVITYSIEARFGGIGTATDAAIADPIPAGTDYVAGSLTLDGARLSDAAGDDAGVFDGRSTAVTLGSVSAPATHVVSFQVRIK